jgi:hypothetical protein
MDVGNEKTNIEISNDNKNEVKQIAASWPLMKDFVHVESENEKIVEQKLTKMQTDDHSPNLNKQQELLCCNRVGFK